MNKQPLTVIAGTQDRPLVIDDIEIPCYVLEDETRVLSQRAMLKGVNIRRGGARGGKEQVVDADGAEMPRFAGQNWLSPFISTDLAVALKSPILFKPPTGGTAAYGYPATILVDICNAILEADAQGATTERQASIVQRATVLIRGFATVGIIALVDEATGYERIREERALANILEKFIAKELQPWTKTFPFEFYQQIFRLKGWRGSATLNRPSVIGHYTNDFVYARLAPGVLQELQRLNPVLPTTGARRKRHHQWFTPDLGHPKLREHLAAVIALMKISPDWGTFKRNINIALPKLTDNLELFGDSA